MGNTTMKAAKRFCFENLSDKYLHFEKLVYNCSVFVGECFHSHAPGDVRPETNPNRSLERSPHVFQFTKAACPEDG